MNSDICTSIASKNISSINEVIYPINNGHDDLRDVLEEQFTTFPDEKAAISNIVIG
jgi:hypothetical protein